MEHPAALLHHPLRRLHILHRAVEPPRKTTGKPPENGKTAGKPLSNCRKTARKPLGNRWPPAKPLENRLNRWKTPGASRKTGGKPLAKPLENRRQNCRWRPLENCRETAGDHWQNCWKTAENRREKPRFWVTFASLNKGPEWPEGSLRRHFSAPGGGCHKGPFSGSTHVLFETMGLAERGFAGF